jgi:hypothetical protein
VIKVLQFNVSLHAAPAGSLPVRSIELDGRVMQAIDVPAPTLAATQLDCSFEDAVARMEALERMFVEPDGSLLWVGEEARERWQVDGTIYDRAGHVQYVEVNGSCPEKQLDELLQALGWPEQQLVFDLRGQGLVLSEAEFRRLAVQR